MRGHELRKKVELCGGRSCRPAVNDQDQRKFAVLLEVRGIEEHAVFLEAVSTLPLEFFGLPKCERGDLMIEISQTSRRIVSRRHVVQLRRLRRRAAAEGDLALAANKSIHPER